MYIELWHNLGLRRLIICLTMLLRFYYKFLYLARYTWSKKCSNNPIFHPYFNKQTTLICSCLGGAVDELSTFRLGYFFLFIPIIKYFKKFQFKLLLFHTYKVINLYLMLWLKLNTSHPQFMPHCCKIGNFMKWFFVSNFTCWFFNGIKFDIFFLKMNKNENFSCMKSIKMHEKPHQNPMGF